MTDKLQYRSFISGIRLRAATAALAVALVLIPGVVATSSAQAQTYTVLYNFTGGGRAVSLRGVDP